MSKSMGVLILKGLGVLLCSVSLFSCTQKGGEDVFVPKKTINWTVTSSPGGGSDIFTRFIADVLNREDLVHGESVVIVNKTDGNGEIGRNEIASLRGSRADYSLLTFNSGDLMPMVDNTKNRAGNFRILSVMAIDKQLLFMHEKSAFTDFASVLQSVEAGSKVVIGGSKGDDVATYEALIAELGLDRSQLPYITYNSTGDAITACLGGHVDLVISKPAAADQYVEAGSLIPILALSNERFAGSLSGAPVLSEVGDYENVEVPVWRAVAASSAMIEAAVRFWSDALRAVSETDAWKHDYIERNKLIDNYLGYEEAEAYVGAFETQYLASRGDRE